MLLVLAGHSSRASYTLNEILSSKQHVLRGSQHIGVPNGVRRVVLIIFLKGVAHSPHGPGRLDTEGPDEGLYLRDE